MDRQSEYDALLGELERVMRLREEAGATAEVTWSANTFHGLLLFFSCAWMAGRLLDLAQAGAPVRPEMIELAKGALDRGQYVLDALGLTPLDGNRTDT